MEEAATAEAAQWRRVGMNTNAKRRTELLIWSFGAPLGMWLKLLLRVLHDFACVFNGNGAAGRVITATDGLCA